MRSYEFNLGRAYQAQQHAAQAWDEMDARRRFASPFDFYEVRYAQTTAKWASRAARLEYALACGYPLATYAAPRGCAGPTPRPGGDDDA